MSESKNLFKGIIGFVFFIILTLIGLRFMAIEMSAGSAGFNLSAIFLSVQIIVIVLCYIAWYRKVNRKAADMMSTADMRKMASGLMSHYILVSFGTTIVIGIIAVPFMILDVFRIGIPAIYSLSSVIIMILLGNLALFLLMKYVVPNRITGSY